MGEIVLTGIKPTGVPHLGNYVGAIRPALARAEDADAAYFFIADYHALNQVQDPAEFNRLSYSLAATWLACGLDPERCAFYRQSDVPETFELTTILAAFTPKGWMNKSHAYKAAVAANEAAGADPDADVNMGLYTYPVLMAADILVFGAHIVPVGGDQVQHVEIARDIAIRFNHHTGTEALVVPEYRVEPASAAVPGLDGRKMSKSYGNVIPLFPGPSGWKKLIMSIKTDSTGRDEPKPAEGSAVYDLYAALAGADEAGTTHAGTTTAGLMTAKEMKAALEAGGTGWGDAKKQLLELVEATFGPMAERYDALMADPAAIDDVLDAGAARIRPAAQERLEQVRRAIGRSGSVRRAT